MPNPSPPKRQRVGEANAMNAADARRIGRATAQNAACGVHRGNGGVGPARHSAPTNYMGGTTSVVPPPAGAGAAVVVTRKQQSPSHFHQTTPGGIGVQQPLGAVASGSAGGNQPKKTRGKVKIEMKYIADKLRRYTTFSKRKSGIMKKAYELSTLTGTDVMVLVASETAHVYTFATKKLQPMITSQDGKALINSCLSIPAQVVHDDPMLDDEGAGLGAGGGSSFAAHSHTDDSSDQSSRLLDLSSARDEPDGGGGEFRSSSSLVFDDDGRDDADRHHAHVAAGGHPFSNGVPGGGGGGLLSGNPMLHVDDNHHNGFIGSNSSNNNHHNHSNGGGGMMSSYDAHRDVSMVMTRPKITDHSTPVRRSLSDTLGGSGGLNNSRSIAGNGYCGNGQTLAPSAGDVHGSVGWSRGGAGAGLDAGSFGLAPDDGAGAPLDGFGVDASGGADNFYKSMIFPSGSGGAFSPAGELGRDSLLTPAAGQFGGHHAAHQHRPPQHAQHDARLHGHRNQQQQQPAPQQPTMVSTFYCESGQYDNGRQRQPQQVQPIDFSLYKQHATTSAATTTTAPLVGGGGGSRCGVAGGARVTTVTPSVVANGVVLRPATVAPNSNAAARKATSAATRKRKK